MAAYSVVLANKNQLICNVKRTRNNIAVAEELL